MPLPISLVECPRDAMQGWPTIISTPQKIEYLQALLAVGFDTLDAGSFVNPNLVPQMADTEEVFRQLDLSSTHTKLLAIVGNPIRAMQAVQMEQLHYIGYPFSLSPTFLKQNLNRNLEQSLQDIAHIQRSAVEHDKTLVLYFSMGFGNPYQDPYSSADIPKWIEYFINQGIRHFSLADTTGVASVGLMEEVYLLVEPFIKEIQLSVHLHAQPHRMYVLADKAYGLGFKRFETTLNGVGGCPFAQDELIGNMDTLVLLKLLKDKVEVMPINQNALDRALALANKLFSNGIQKRVDHKTF